MTLSSLHPVTYFGPNKKDDGRYNISDSYHLVFPSANEEIYYKCNPITPYRNWINLFDEDIFLLSLFDFATFDNRRSKDRIYNVYWRALVNQSAKLENSVPRQPNSEALLLCGYTTSFRTYMQIFCNVSVKYSI